jgi:thiamine-phosphate pyrophosphorylase
MLDRRRLEVYVVTSAASGPGVFGSGRDHHDIAAAAIAGGATAVQLRAPELSDDELLVVAAEIADACHRSNVMFIVNDRVEVAITSGADGVHVGQDDDPISVRRRLGPDRVLGVSVSTLAHVNQAELAGADYLGVTVWATPTKPDAVPRGLEAFRDIVRSTPIPVVGIGGIFASNGTLVLEAGGAGLAVISAVAAAPDPVAATRELAGVVQRFRSREEVPS